MRLHLFLVSLLVLVLVGCPRSYVDDDLEAQMARQIVLDMEIADELNTKIGDKTDWKRVVPMADGDVTLSFVVGDPFVGSHELVGDIMVFDSNKDVVARAQLDSMTTQYRLKWSAEAQSGYWVRFRANSGKAKYTVSYKQKRQDPCAKCTGINQSCVDGKCVTIEAPRQVKCSGRLKMSPKTGKCVPNLCHKVRCPSGEVCRMGECRAKRLPSTGCRPPCSSSERCVRNRCVSKKKKVIKDGPTVVRYKVKVISRSAAGNTTYLVLNKGSAHGVKVGDKGALGGIGFRVIEVYGVRCKVRVAAPIGKLSGKSSGYLKATR